MIFKKQMSEFQSYTTILTSFRAVINRLSRVPGKVTLANLLRGLRDLFVPVFVGVFFFAGFADLFFGVSLRRGVSEIWALPSPLWWCGCMATVAIVLGSWSVGGAFCHVSALIWGWLRLYSAGGK